MSGSPACPPAGPEWARAAERAVCARHLHRLLGIPGTALAWSAWPPAIDHLVQCHWNYWWQAHVLDCLVDAEARDPDAARRSLIEKFIRTVRLRNAGSWTNPAYDDMAWLGLALQRAGTVVERDTTAAVRVIRDQLSAGWTGDAGGGIWWRRGDWFKNTPTNGPAAILHARCGQPGRARQLFEWMENLLVERETGLVLDGYRVDSQEFVSTIYTYCQGVFLGACLELSEMDAARRTVYAIAEYCAPRGALFGQGGGDGGLFAGILARYLALAARLLPAGDAATLAGTLLRDSARACWQGRVELASGPLFSAQWADPAPSRARLRKDPAKDLSVQTGAWMLFEATATLES